MWISMFRAFKILIELITSIALQFYMYVYVNLGSICMLCTFVMCIVGGLSPKEAQVEYQIDKW